MHTRLAFAALLAVATASLASAQSAFFLGTHAGANGSKFRYTEDLSVLYPTSDRLAGLNVGLDAGVAPGLRVEYLVEVAAVVTEDTGLENLESG